MKQLIYLPLLAMMAAVLTGCPLIETDDDNEGPQPAAAPAPAAPKQPTQSIQQAAATGEIDEVRANLFYGIRLDDADDAGNTALHHAAKNSHNDIVILLGNRGADINARNAAGQTPLALASDEAVIAYLTQMGGTK